MPGVVTISTTQVELVVAAQVRQPPKQPQVQIKIQEAPVAVEGLEVEEKEENDLDKSEQEFEDEESERGDDTSLSIPESPVYEGTARN